MLLHREEKLRFRRLGDFWAKYNIATKMDTHKIYNEISLCLHKLKRKSVICIELKHQTSEYGSKFFYAFYINRMHKKLFVDNPMHKRY